MGADRAHPKGCLWQPAEKVPQREGLAGLETRGCAGLGRVGGGPEWDIGHHPLSCTATTAAMLPHALGSSHHTHTHTCPCSLKLLL